MDAPVGFTANLADRICRYRNGAYVEVMGWVDETCVTALHDVAIFQRQNRVTGAGLEIGVFHGRFFLAILAALEPWEHATAIDIFDDQHLNIDGSGAGEGLERIFNFNVAHHANFFQAHIIKADSQTIDAETILAPHAGSRIRLASVDGGHTPAHVVNDLALAEAVLAPGGVVMLDDWMSPHWPGVHEGYLRSMDQTQGLAPVLYTGNKLFMTTVDYHQPMLEWMQAQHRTQKLVKIARSCGFDFISAV